MNFITEDQNGGVKSLDVILSSAMTEHWFLRYVLVRRMCEAHLPGRTAFILRVSRG